MFRPSLVLWVLLPLPHRFSHLRMVHTAMRPLLRNRRSQPWEFAVAGRRSVWRCVIVSHAGHTAVGGCAQWECRHGAVVDGSAEGPCRVLAYFV